MGPGSQFQRIWKYRKIDSIDKCEAIFLSSGKFVYDIDDILEKEKR